jgi:hypothetical protein
MAEQNTSYSEFMQRLSKQIVEGFERAHEVQVKAIERVREAVQPFLPDLGRIELPFADALPTPLSVAQANFAFAEELLRAQRSFTLGLIESLTGEEKPAERGA